jgi:uncharacterized protein (TIGR03437 family)
MPPIPTVNPLLLFLALTGAASAQTITTYAGGDNIFTGIGQKATSVQIGQMTGITTDDQENVYVSSAEFTMVFKIAPNGVVTVVAGNGLPGGGSGVAVGASLYSPAGLAVDQSGNLYIADGAVNVVHKVDTSGIISTVAGTGAGGHSGDGGPAAEAELISPNALAVDKSGNLYIAEVGGYVRQVTPGGTISTVAGNGLPGYTGDGGPATKATFNYPTGLAVDAAGNIYLADQYNCAVRKFVPGGNINTVAGGKCGQTSGDGGPASDAQIGFITGVAIDSSGALYISDASNENIRRVSAAGIISTFAGNSQTGFSGDGGPALQASFNSPGVLAVDSTGAVVVVDLANNRLRRIAGNGIINTIAGETFTNGDAGASTDAVLTNPGQIAVDAAGNVYVPDSSQYRVRRIASSGIITTVAGTGTPGYSGDGGPATTANINGANAVAVDQAGDLFIAVGIIRRVDASTGAITTFAGGNGSAGTYSGNGTGGDGGPAIAATINFITSMAVDAGGNVYLTDLIKLANGTLQGGVVRRITTDGNIHTYAGAGFGFGGDGSPAIKALLGNNLTISIGPDGSLYIADLDNNRVRRVDPGSGIISTVAGNGQAGPSGDGGQAKSAGVAPWSINVDKAGNIYIGSPGIVRKVNPAGVIGTYAGSGLYQTGGDGELSKDASMGLVSSLATDAAGNVYLVDGKRIRIVEAVAPVLTISPVSLNFTSTGATNQSITVSNGAASGTMNWAAIATTNSGGDWLTVTPASGSSVAGKPGAALNVSIQATGLAAGDYYGEVQITSPSTVNAVEIVTVRLTVGTAGPPPPTVGSVVSTATYIPKAAVSPGMIVAIFGTNMTNAGGLYGASSLPLPRELGGTSVTIGTELLPLIIVTPGQINAILPLDLPVNTALPLVVTHSNAISVPEPVTLTADAAGIFTVPQNGTGTGIVVIVHPDGTQVHAGNGNAATAGDSLVIYGTGMGAVNPREVAGAPAITQPLSQTNDPVTVAIGGVNAPVTFAGPTPGATGLYQVDVTVPKGIAPSSAAPLVLTQGGKSSPSSVTVPVH